jgi:DNA-binding beta-propeller fold protein YncE
LLALTLAVAAGCESAPPDMAELLEPKPGAKIWPLEPERPRFAYVGTLIGEADFSRGQAPKRTFVNALKWIAGVIAGEADRLELRRPVSGMTGDDDRVYVVDTGHRAVMVFDMLKGRFLKWELATRGIPFASPVGIADDGRGGVLVTDSELGEVFNLDGRGNPVGRWGKGILTRPTGIARDANTGYIYVADTRAHDIKIFDDHGVLVDLLGNKGEERGAFNTPTYLAVSSGELYVADTLNFRVQIFDTAGDDRLSFGRLGLYVGNMTRPKGVAVGSDGRIYVVESYFDHLLVYDRSGQLLLPIGGTGHGVGEFYLPAGVWTDNSGRVYIADMFNGRIVILKDLSKESAP